MDILTETTSAQFFGTEAPAKPKLKHKAKKQPANPYPFPAPAVTEERFLRDVSGHTMTIKQDNGLYRHLHFANQGSFNQWFEITTWPGRLCIAGDMGTFVFRRLEDMFQFFRCQPTNKETLPINPGYWAQKCDSRDRDGVEKYSAEHFRAQVWEWMKEGEWTGEAIQAAIEEVMPVADEGEYAAISQALSFEFCGHNFQDFYEVEVKVYTAYYLWCCYAIVWAIQQYDKAKAQEATP